MNDIYEKKYIRNKSIDQNYNIVLIYDNFEFSENRRDERISETR